MDQRWKTWAKRIVMTIAAVTLGLALFVAICFFTPPGHRLVAGLIASLTGDRVVVTGLSGDLPNHLSAQRVTLSDGQGPWLVLEDIRIDWDALSALGDHIMISEARAARVTLLRREIARQSTSTSTTTIDIGSLELDRIELKPQALGHAAILSAKGSLHYASRHDVAAELVLQRIDAFGRYDIHAAIAEDILRGTISISESGAGLAGSAIGLPDLGSVALELRATAEGTRNNVQLKFAADKMDASGTGTMDIAAQKLDLDFTVAAAKMQPSKDLSWSSITAKGNIHGSLSAPVVDADFRLADLAVKGTRSALLSVVAKGAEGKLTVQVQADGLTLPGEKAGVFAASPMSLTAVTDLNSQARAVEFVLDHPLLRVSGTTTTRDLIRGQITATVPSLEKLEPLSHVKLAGTAKATATFARDQTGLDVTAKGSVATAGSAVLARLFGNTAFDATARVSADGALALRASLKGAAIRAEVAGSARSGRHAFTGELTISDLSRLSGTLMGSLNLHGSYGGPQDNAKLSINGIALAATKGMPRQTIAIEAQAAGLPKLKTATLRLSGSFDNARVKLGTDITAEGADGWKLTIAEGSWKSAKLGGAVTLVASAPRGNLKLSVGNLADVAPLLGAPLTGSLEAATDLLADTASVRIAGSNIASGATTLGRVDITGTVRSLSETPNLALTLALPQLAANGVSGSATLGVNGPLNALALTLNTALSLRDGHRFTAAVEGAADIAAKHLTVTRLQLLWRDQTITLAAPATLDYANGLSFSASLKDGKAADLTVTGTIPEGHAMAVHAVARADLAVLTSELAAGGQIVSGSLNANFNATGTLAKPLVVGKATLSKAQIQDYPRGLNINSLEAELEAQGSTLRITKFSGKAGTGTITGSGTIDLAAAGMPVNMNFTAADARAVSSDLLTANVDSQLTLTGHLADRLLLKGTISVNSGTINIPEKFPKEIATLNIRRGHGAPPQAPPPSSSLVALELTVESEGQIFVRGRGLEAEFEGDLTIGGTTASPQVQGALTMRRGTLSLAGTNLTFQSGEISFNGQALRKRIDPTLDLVAQSQANGITATLKITGTASQPKIAFSSSPPLPQDEVLSQLLFQQSAKSLSAMQLASVAQAAASLGGGGGFDPVGIMRSSLGLDRLAVGSSRETTGSSASTTIEAGKYVFRNVYVGARQDLAGGTRALVQVDITKHLKAQAQVNSGPRPATTTTSTPLTDNGDSIGFSYQFEY